MCLVVVLYLHNKCHKILSLVVETAVLTNERVRTVTSSTASGANKCVAHMYFCVKDVHVNMTP